MLLFKIEKRLALPCILLQLIAANLPFEIGRQFTNVCTVRFGTKECSLSLQLPSRSAEKPLVWLPKIACGLFTYIVKSDSGSADSAAAGPGEKAEWRNMAEWRNGGIAEWRNGGIAE